MDNYENDSLYDENAIKIPDEFYNEKEKAPFTNCLVCETELLHEGTHYVVEKAFKRSLKTKEFEVIMEYAICVDCLTKLQDEISEESQKNIEMYFKLYVDMDKRSHDLLSREDKHNLKNWIGSCALSKKNIDQLDEYQIYGQFEGDNMLFTQLPYMVSGNILDEVQELMSEKTKGIIDGFKDTYLPKPPSLEDDWVKDKRLVFI